MNSRLNPHYAKQKDLLDVKADVSVLKTDVAQLKVDVAELKADVRAMKNSFEDFVVDMSELFTLAFKKIDKLAEIVNSHEEQIAELRSVVINTTQRVSFLEEKTGFALSN